MTYLPTPQELLDAMTTKKENSEATGAPGTISGTVDARAFTDRLKLIKKHAGVHSTIPILNCATIEFDGLGARMKLSYYGIDMELQATLPAEGSGAVVVPMVSLLAFVSAADGQTIAIDKKEDDSFVTFTCGRYAAKLIPLPVPDLPRLTLPDVFTRGFGLGEGVLAHLFALSAPFSSKEETRYYLNGVAFECHENSVRVVATNGHSLGTRATATPAPLEAWNYTAIVPNNVVDALSGIFGKKQCTVRFNAEFIEGKMKTRMNGGKVEDYKEPDGWGLQRAQFSCDGWTITTKLIDGNFPDWRRVVPKTTAVFAGATLAVATIKAEDIARASKMARPLKNTRGIRVEPTESSGVRFSMDASVDSAKISGEFEAEVEGTFQPFGVNVHYFSTTAKAIGTEKVKMYITGSGEPFMLTGVDAPEDDFAVLMPMRV